MRRRVEMERRRKGVAWSDERAEHQSRTMKVFVLDLGAWSSWWRAERARRR